MTIGHCKHGTTLEEQIKVVAEVRRKAGEANFALQSAQAMWEVAIHTLFEEKELTKIQCGESEQLLRELTLQAYAETGDKHPAKGVDIREITTYSYDEAEALKWAIEHKMALKLDETKFKNHVKADPPDFVTVTQEPQATIATNLGEVGK